MKLYFRYSNDPKRFKPLVTTHPSTTGPYWVVTTTTIDGTRRVYVTESFTKAIAKANRWADEYRAAWVERNMQQIRDKVRAWAA